MESKTNNKLLDIIDRMSYGWKDNAANELKKECLTDMVEISEIINRNNNEYRHRVDDIWMEANHICEKVKNFGY